MSFVVKHTFLLLAVSFIGNELIGQTTVSYFEDKMPNTDSIVYHRQVRYSSGVIKHEEYTHYGHYSPYESRGPVVITWFKVFRLYSRKGTLLQETLIAPPEKKGIYSRGFDKKGEKLDLIEYGYWSLKAYSDTLQLADVANLPVAAYRNYKNDSKLITYKDVQEPDLRVNLLRGSFWFRAYISKWDLINQVPDYEYERFQVSRTHLNKRYRISIYDRHLEDTLASMHFLYDNPGPMAGTHMTTYLPKTQVVPDYGLIYKHKGVATLLDFNFQPQITLPKRTEYENYYLVKGDSPENSRIWICERLCGLYKLDGHEVLPKEYKLRIIRFGKYVGLYNDEYFAFYTKDGKQVSEAFSKKLKFEYQSPHYAIIKTSKYASDSIIYDINQADTVSLSDAIFDMAREKGITVKRRGRSTWIENSDGHKLLDSLRDVDDIQLVSKNFAVIKRESRLKKPNPSVHFSLFEIASGKETIIEKSRLSQLENLIPLDNFFSGPAKMRAEISGEKPKEVYLLKTGKIIRTDTFGVTIDRTSHHRQFLVSKYGKRGVMTFDGKVIVPTDNRLCLPFREGYLIQKGQHTKMLSKDGRVLMPARNADVYSMLNAINWDPFTTTITISSPIKKLPGPN